MAEGTLIAESLRVGANLEGVRITVTKIHREEASLSPVQLASGLSPLWTLIDFEISDDRAAQFAAMLAGALGTFGWYANFQSHEESFVVFADRVFRYPRGESKGRQDAQAYARSRGVPDSQLDWSA